MWLLIACIGRVPEGKYRPADTGAPADSAGDSAVDTDSAADSAPDSADSGRDSADSAADSGDSGDSGAVADPCAHVIPADARVFDADTTLPEDAVVGWVCRNRTVSSSGAEATLFVEDGGNIVMSGSGGRAYVKAGARAAFYGTGTEVWYGEGAAIRVEGTDVALHACPTLAFTGGPADGC